MGKVGRHEKHVKLGREVGSKKLLLLRCEKDETGRQTGKCVQQLKKKIYLVKESKNEEKE